MIRQGSFKSDKTQYKKTQRDRTVVHRGFGTVGLTSNLDKHAVMEKLFDTGPFDPNNALHGAYRNKLMNVNEMVQELRAKIMSAKHYPCIEAYAAYDETIGEEHRRWRLGVTFEDAPEDGIDLSHIATYHAMRIIQRCFAAPVLNFRPGDFMWSMNNVNDAVVSPLFAPGRSEFMNVVYMQPNKRLDAAVTAVSSITDRNDEKQLFVVAEDLYKTVTLSQKRSNEERFRIAMDRGNALTLNCLQCRIILKAIDLGMYVPSDQILIKQDKHDWSFLSDNIFENIWHVSKARKYEVGVIRLTSGSGKSTLHKEINAKEPDLVLDVDVLYEREGIMDELRELHSKGKWQEANKVQAHAIERHISKSKEMDPANTVLLTHGTPELNPELFTVNILFSARATNEEIAEVVEERARTDKVWAQATSFNNETAKGYHVAPREEIKRHVRDVASVWANDNAHRSEALETGSALLDVAEAYKKLHSGASFDPEDLNPEDVESGEDPDMVVWVQGGKLYSTDHKRLLSMSEIITHLKRDLNAGNTTIIVTPESTDVSGKAVEKSLREGGNPPFVFWTKSLANENQPDGYTPGFMSLKENFGGTPQADLYIRYPFKDGDVVRTYDDLLSDVKDWRAKVRRLSTPTKIKTPKGANSSMVSMATRVYEREMTISKNYSMSTDRFVKDAIPNFMNDNTVALNAPLPMARVPQLTQLSKYVTTHGVGPLPVQFSHCGPYDILLASRPEIVPPSRLKMTYGVSALDVIGDTKQGSRMRSIAYKNYDGSTLLCPADEAPGPAKGAPEDYYWYRGSVLKDHMPQISEKADPDAYYMFFSDPFPEHIHSAALTVGNRMYAMGVGSVIVVAHARMGQGASLSDVVVRKIVASERGVKQLSGHLIHMLYAHHAHYLLCLEEILNNLIAKKTSYPFSTLGGDEEVYHGIDEYRATLEYVDCLHLPPYVKLRVPGDRKSVV